MSVAYFVKENKKEKKRKKIKSLDAVSDLKSGRIPIAAAILDSILLSSRISWAKTLLEAPPLNSKASRAGISALSVLVSSTDLSFPAGTECGPAEQGPFPAATLLGKALQSGLLVDTEPFQGAAGRLCSRSELTRSHMAMWSGTRVNEHVVALGRACCYANGGHMAFGWL